VTQAAYDRRGNAVSVKRYAGLMAGVSPDTTSTSAPNRATTTTWNAFGQLATTVDARNFWTIDTYDLAGNLSTQTRYATPSAGSAPAVDAANE